jgi:hypothetical protein
MHSGEFDNIEGLVGKQEGKRSVRRPIYRWEYNIRLDLRELGWDRVIG